MKPTEIIVEYGRGAASLIKKGATAAPRIFAFIDKIADKLARLPISLANSYFATSSNDLLAGRLEEYATKHWPKEKWPTAWMEIPSDIRRPVVWDGKLIGGIDVSWLANKHITEDVVREFSARAMRFAFKGWLISILLLAIYFTIGRTSMLTLPWHVQGHDFPAWAWHVAPSAVAGYLFAAVVNSIYNLVGFAWFAVIEPLKIGLYLFCPGSRARGSLSRVRTSANRAASSRRHSARHHHHHHVFSQRDEAQRHVGVAAHARILELTPLHDADAINQHGSYRTCLTQGYS